MECLRAIALIHIVELLALFGLSNAVYPVSFSGIPN